MITNKITLSLAILIVAGLIVIYKTFNPAQYAFPKCPFLTVTGLQCPGCGSQRAVHHLLNFEIQEAFVLNPLLLFSIPYLLVGFFFENIALTQTTLKVRNVLYGRNATFLILAIVLLFWVLRNIV